MDANTTITLLSIGLAAMAIGALQQESEQNTRCCLEQHIKRTQMGSNLGNHPNG